MGTKPLRNHNSIRRLRPGEAIPTSEPRRYRTSDGYIVLRWKTGVRTYLDALEHRIVNGRITTAEHIHHINHSTTDNRPSNLEGLTPKEHREKHSRVDWVDAWRLYKQGSSTIEVGDKLGCSASQISRGLRQRGHTLRDPGVARRLILDTGRIVELFLAGMPPRRIGELFGVSDSPIRRILQDEGIPPRQPGRPLRSAQESSH